jgi:hypothetical protein
VAAEQIAQNLAFVNWTMLVGLALGSFAAVVVGRLVTEATRGFLSFTAFAAFVLGLAALSSDLALPVTLEGSPIVSDPTWDGPRRAALAAFDLLAGLYVIALIRRIRAPAIALAGLGAGLATLVFASLAWGGSIVGAVPLLLQLLALSAATGGVLAAMILGHWYLVTPKLVEAPLILFGRLLLGVVALQLLLFVAWAAGGIGPGAGDGPFAALVGPWSLFVWLRLVVGLAFPLVLSWAALQTARTRSMESATGLLYIDAGVIAAGTILAAGLYFGAGLLV